MTSGVAKLLQIFPEDLKSVERTHTVTRKMCEEEGVAKTNLRSDCKYYFPHNLCLSGVKESGVEVGEVGWGKGVVLFIYLFLSISSYSNLF